ncbi:hypothetical protein ACFLZX_02495 [Nanoarchaeota archaeon]
MAEEGVGYLENLGRISEIRTARIEVNKAIKLFHQSKKTAKGEKEALEAVDNAIKQYFDMAVFVIHEVTVALKELGENEDELHDFLSKNKEAHELLKQTITHAADLEGKVETALARAKEAVREDMNKA